MNKPRLPAWCSSPRAGAVLTLALLGVALWASTRIEPRLRPQRAVDERWDLSAILDPWWCESAEINRWYLEAAENQASFSPEAWRAAEPQGRFDMLHCLFHDVDFRRKTADEIQELLGPLAWAMPREEGGYRYSYALEPRPGFRFTALQVEFDREERLVFAGVDPPGGLETLDEVVAAYRALGDR